MAMGVNLQILFFTGIIALQVILIIIIVRGFKILQGAVNFTKQEGPVENKKKAEVHIKGEEKEIKKLYKIPEGEELLFIKQVKLNKENPATEMNIIADRKEK